MRDALGWLEIVTSKIEMRDSECCSQGAAEPRSWCGRRERERERGTGTGIGGMDSATRNPQPATRNPEPATRNPQPATRNSEPGGRQRSAVLGRGSGRGRGCGWDPKTEPRNPRPVSSILSPWPRPPRTRRLSVRTVAEPAGAWSTRTALRWLGGATAPRPRGATSCSGEPGFRLATATARSRASSCGTRTTRRSAECGARFRSSSISTPESGKGLLLMGAVGNREDPPRRRCAAGARFPTKGCRSVCRLHIAGARDPDDLRRRRARAARSCAA